MTSNISRLCSWYSRQCNGDWEHSYGVKIDTLDNPGWLVTIDVLGTALDEKQFEEQWSDRESETRWMHCAKRDGRFHAACGPEALEDVLAVFLSWAEQ